MLLVNARLPFITVDLWYKRLPNNTAVLAVVGTQTGIQQQLTDSDLQLFIETEQDQKRQSFIQQFDVNC